MSLFSYNHKPNSRDDLTATPAANISKLTAHGINERWQIIRSADYDRKNKKDEHMCIADVKTIVYLKSRI